jgi:hypothetical protein
MFGLIIICGPLMFWGGVMNNINIYYIYIYIYININNYQYYHKCTYIQTQTISTMIWMFTKYINIY